jgi:hypothetical protein
VFRKNYKKQVFKIIRLQSADNVTTTAERFRRSAYFGAAMPSFGVLGGILTSKAERP